MTATRIRTIELIDCWEAPLRFSSGSLKPVDASPVDVSLVVPADGEDTDAAEDDIVVPVVLGVLVDELERDAAALDDDDERGTTAADEELGTTATDEELGTTAADEELGRRNGVPHTALVLTIYRYVHVVTSDAVTMTGVVAVVVQTNLTMVVRFLNDPQSAPVKLVTFKPFGLRDHKVGLKL